MTFSDSLRIYEVLDVGVLSCVLMDVGWWLWAAVGSTWSLCHSILDCF